MAESKKEYLKIWFSDIDAAADYFDGNQKHLGEFLLNVYRSYAELPTRFTCKQVEKYFKTYQKQIDYIKGQKIKGGIRHDNQEDTEPTLLGSLQGTPLDSVLPKEKREKIKDKEEILKEKLLLRAQKKESFKNELIPFVEEFSKETVRAFFDYWTEESKTGIMRIESEKFFDNKKRLTTWKKREKPTFGTQTIKPIAHKPQAYDNING